MDTESIFFQHTPQGFSLDEVTVRLAEPEERCRWDALMNEFHYLGFNRFAGRGLRYVFEWQGRWVGLAGWQSGAFKCQPRDLWIGWRRKEQFKRLHLIGNNTRFLILGDPGVFANLASWALAAMTRRLSDDWRAAYGHPLVVVETFVDPSQFSGDMYIAADWSRLGRTKGFARASGRYTDPHGVPKDLYVFALQRDARRRLCQPDPLPEALAPRPMGTIPDTGGMRSLYQELQRLPDCRRAQGRKHSIATVMAVVILARLAGENHCLAAAGYAKSMSQEQLAAIGAWKNPRTGRFEPVSKSTLYRVMETADPDAMEEVLKRYSVSRLKIGAALASDGKRIRGANRHSDGRHETAVLVEHDTGLPIATLGFHDEGGEIAAVQALLEQVPVAGRVITVDALHTVRNTARAIVETHGADYLMAVKGNASETFETLATIDWERDASDRFQEEYEKANGRITSRSIRAMTPLKGMVNYPHLAQIFRIRRRRISCDTGKENIETAYGITSVPKERGTPEQLLAWNRGHWAVENINHRARDVNFNEDGCMAHTGNMPVNNALCNCIALAVILTRSSKVAETRRYFGRNPDEAMKALLSPD